MKRTVPVLLLTGLTLVSQAAELGMKAPPLEIATWVKGKAVDLGPQRDTNKIYVVEFWATWCPPCRTSIPHLTKLQEKFKDRGVTIIGISDEPASTVAPFVEKMGATMEYTVAVDNHRKTAKAYMEAFGEDGIPHAFVVNREGRIAWHGHPLAGLDQVIDDVVEGRHDIESAKRSMAAAAAMNDYFTSLEEGADLAKARELGERIVRDGARDADLLNTFAWIILTHPRVKQRDFELATRAARSAYEHTEGKEASIADTYARALFESGKRQEAIELQKKAIASAADTDQREQLQKTLEEYEAKLKKN